MNWVPMDLSEMESVDVLQWLTCGVNWDIFHLIIELPQLLMEKEEEVVESFIIPIYDRPIKICDGVLTY